MNSLPTQTNSILKEANLLQNKKTRLFPNFNKKASPFLMSFFLTLFFSLFFILSGFGQIPLSNHQVVESWVKRWVGMADGNTSSIALDVQGNVYTTGSQPGVVKYDSSGNQQWALKYNANAFRVGGLAVDEEGNVYLAKTSYNDNASYPDENYVTRKLSSSGQQQWLAIYNNIEENDIVAAIAVDQDGNVYVTGRSLSSDPPNYIYSYNYATVKYDSTGAEQWVARYDGVDNLDDYATALAVDAEGNVYVTGYSEGEETGVSYATIKYNSLGEQQWEAKYNSPNGLNSFARALALDAEGNVYVTGSSETSGTGADYATIKYNPAGVQQWVAKYNAPDNLDDETSSIKVDMAGNVYVSGTSTRLSGVSCNYPTVWAMVKYNALGVQQWVANFDGTGTPSMDIDLEGNVYATGGSFNSECEETDYATVKFNNTGIKQWEIAYDGPEGNNDYASSIVVDSLQQVYVTGSSQSADSYDLTTIKYTQKTSQELMAVDDTYATEQGTSLTVEAPGVLSNDVAGSGDTLAASLVMGTTNGTLAFNADGSFTYTPDSAFIGDDSFTYKASSGMEESNEATVTITVNPVGDGLVIQSISVPSAPQKTNSIINVSAIYSGDNISAAVWVWGDGSGSEGNIGDSLITGSHSYSHPGLYTISLTITDAEGDSASLQHRYVVIYDPTTDIVAGIGSFHSPVGSYVNKPNAKGKVDFGFGIQTTNGSNEPQGKVVFKTNAGDIKFTAKSFESMDIAGKTAIVTGTGMLNGEGNQHFQLSMNDDSSLTGMDYIRLQIWDSLGTVVYDNQMGDSLNAVATTALNTGNIVVHNGNSDNDERAVNKPLSLKDFIAYPVPLSGDGLWLDFPTMDKSRNFKVLIKDMNGRKMAEKQFKSDKAGISQLWELSHHSWPAGIYVLTIEGAGVVHQLKLSK